MKIRSVQLLLGSRVDLDARFLVGGHSSKLAAKELTGRAEIQVFDDDWDGSSPASAVRSAVRAWSEQVALIGEQAIRSAPRSVRALGML